MKNSSASCVTSSPVLLATVILLLSYASLCLGRPSASYSDSRSESEEVYEDRLLFPDEIPLQSPTYAVKSISNLNYPQNAYYSTNSLERTSQSDAGSEILSEEEPEIDNEFDFRLGDGRTSHSSTNYFEPCGPMRGDEKTRFSSSSWSKFLPCGSKPPGTKG